MNADFSGVIENSHDRHNLINKQKLLKYMPHIAVRILEFLEELTSANIKLLHFEEMFLTLSIFYRMVIKSTQNRPVSI